MLYKISVITSLILAVVIAYYYNDNFNLLEPESIVVKTPLGLVQGYQGLSRDSRHYWSFQGIPFAQPPLGKLRFQPPESIQPWTNILDAKKLPSPCIQFDNLAKRQTGSENCLFLNIYAPKRIPIKDKSKANHLLPVLVFIHGGSFLYGKSEHYAPQYFMDEDVILVVVQYRLGILGFLNTEDDSIRGNMGLKDQVMALKWIHQNIRSFGGDQKRITVFGESAGSACVHYLILSNQTKGLINSAIMESGTALSSWSFITSARKQAFRVGNVVGCSDFKSSEDLLSCLLSVDAKEFIELHAREEEFWSEKFGPSLEHPMTENSKKSAFLQTPPKDISFSGNYNKIPLLLGVVENEGCILANAIMNKLDKINDDWNQMSTVLDIYNDPTKLMAVREMYFGTKQRFDDRDLLTFTKLVSDRHFFTGTHDTAVNHIKGAGTSKQPTLYMYYFNYPGRKDKTELGIGHLVRTKPIPFLPVDVSLGLEMLKLWTMDLLGFPIPNYGVCHADDLKYQFMQHPLMKIDRNSPNYNFSKYYIKLWVNFATVGKPSFNDEWTRATNPNDLKYFEISGTSSHRMVSDPIDSKRLLFWKDIEDWK